MIYIYKENGKTIKKDIKKAEFSNEYDVIVAGLGVAGTTAAIMSAANGLKTLGIERFDCMGGMMTAGGVCGYYIGNEGGVFEKIDDEIEKYREDFYDVKFQNIDCRKYVLEKCAVESGVNVLYSSIITALFVEGRNICGVEIFANGELKNVRTKALIDATGDAEICDMAGCALSFGREFDNSVMPFTAVAISLKDGSYVRTNDDCGIIDQRDIYAYSKAIIDAYSVFSDEESNRLTLRIASLPGIREGNVIDGRRRLTAHDFLLGERAQNPVIYAYSDLDKHGQDTAFDSEIFRKWRMLSNLAAANVTVPIPLDCLLPKEYDNIIVAGRSLSVDHELLTCTRMNRDMQKLGEVCADAVKISIETGRKIADINYALLKSMLEKTGCLSESNNKGFCYDEREKKNKGQIKWLKNADEINRALSSFEPGVAIWSCFIAGDKIRENLCKNLESDNENLRKHSAFALASLEDNRCADVLKSIVNERDGVILRDLRKINQCRIVMAICGLGILKDKSSADMLINIITDENEYKNEIYSREREEYRVTYYKVLSHSTAALMAIAKKHPDLREKITNAFDKAFSDLSYILKITNKDAQSSEYKTALGIYNAVNIFKEKRE